MGRFEAGISVNPHKLHETIYHEDGTMVVTSVEKESPKPHVSVGRAHLAEADHVIVAFEEGVEVVFAQASEEEGVTQLAEPNATVAAAHWDRGGDGVDNKILEAMDADKGAARRRASSIKERRAHERDAIAELLAVRGSANGFEMGIAAANAREEHELGGKIKVTVSLIDLNGTKTSVQATAREKDMRIKLPNEIAESLPKPVEPPIKRRKLVLAA